MALSHEEFKPKVAQFLSHTNKVFALLGAANDAVLSTATNVATAQPLVLAAAVPAAVHESDYRIVERWVSQALPRANALGIFTDTDIAASNTYALARTAIVANDSSLSTSYESSLEDD